MVGKKVVMDLVGLDGNAFNLMGQFRKNAQRQGWKKDEIDAVLDECQKGDYNHLLNTLMDNTESPEEEDDDEEDEYVDDDDYDFEEEDDDE